MSRKLLSAIVKRIVALLILALLAGVVSLQIPGVQTRLADIALDRLQTIFDGKITIDEIKVQPNGSVVLKNLLIIDNEPYTEDPYDCGWARVDTLARIGSLSATVRLGSLFKKDGIKLSRATVKDGLLHLTTEPGHNGNLQRVFHLEPDPQKNRKTPADEPPILSIRKVKIRNFRFRMNNFSKPVSYSGHGICFDDMDATAVELDARNFRIDGSVISGICDHAELTEKSGLRINHISTSCRAGMGKVLLDDLHIQDDSSDISLGFFNMIFDGPEAFADYVNQVRMVAKFNPSKVSMQTISYFGGASLKDNKILFDIHTGHFDGTVADFNVKNINFTDLTSGVSGVINGHCGGLPDTGLFTVDANLSNFLFNTRQLSGFVSNWAGSNINLSKIAPGKMFSLNASTGGKLNMLKINGVLSHSSGNVGIDCQLLNVLDKNIAPGIAGSIDTEGIDLGQILDMKDLGMVSLSSKLDARFRHSGTDANIDTLVIRSADFRDYRYHDIYASACLLDGRLEAGIDSRDNNCTLFAEASADLKNNGTDNRKFLINADFANIDLAAMNLVKTKEKAALSMKVKADMDINSESFLEGKLNLGTINYNDGKSQRNFGDLELSASQSGEKQSYIIGADFIKASYLGGKQPFSLAGDFQAATTQAELSNLYKEIPARSDSTFYNMKITLGEVNGILGIIKPGLYLEKGTSIDLKMDEYGRAGVELTSGRIAIGPNFMKGVKLTFDNAADIITAKINVKELKAANYTFENPKITASADNNHIDAILDVDDGTQLGRTVNIRLLADLLRDENGNLIIGASTKDSFLRNEGRQWDFSPACLIKDSEGIHVRNFTLSHNDQTLSLEGNYRPDAKDTLKLNMNRVDLSLLDAFLETPYNIHGNTSGNIRLITREEKGLAMLMNIGVDSLKVGNEDAGNIRMRSIWDTERNRISLMLKNEIGDHQALGIRGHYTPETKNLHAEAKFDSLALGIVSPFLRDIMTEMGGSLSGDLFIDGPVDSLTLSSKGARLNEAMIRLAYTGVPYTISGDVDINNLGVFFDDMQIRDDQNGEARLKGVLKHKNLKDISLDAKMDFKRLQVIDTPDLGNNSFYGSLKASGSASVKGPFNALTIEANVRTDGSGNIHVPLSGSLSSSSGKLLTYTDHTEYDDPYELILKDYLKNKGNGGSDLRIKAHADITPGVKAFMEIDKSVGNVISFNGSGQVNLEIRPMTNLFNLNGDYDILEGKYHFVLPGIMEKDLDIRSGSSVAFGGDLLDTRINMTATHSLRASLSSLLAESTAAGARRNVVCGITINDKLRNPKIDFFIDIPDLDPALQSEVQTCLNTDDKVQKQFVALLLMGSFLPSEQSGVFNGTNMLYSNLTEVVSSQMSNILKKLDIPLDFGFKYQENKTGNNVFDVAVSTQLFNNRVLVSGSLGNRQFKPATSGASDVIGDIDIQVKLDKPGRYRITLFSHSADERTNFLDYTQRNGIGLSFQKDFKAKKKNTENKNIIISIENGKTVSDSLSTGGKRSKRGHSAVRSGKGMQP